MLPILEVPESIRQGMTAFRPVFCREEGFDHVSRFVTGLIISPNKTLQGIYDLQVWGPDGGPSRRAMHEAVFETGWSGTELMRLQRGQVAQAQSRGGRQVISLDWTLAHHERGPEIFANSRAWDSRGGAHGPVPDGGDRRPKQPPACGWAGGGGAGTATRNKRGARVLETYGTRKL